MRANALTDFIISLISGVAFLALTVVATSRAKRDPLARLLSLLCVDLVAYGTSEAISTLTTHGLWDWINQAAASLAPALFYHLVIAFVGQRRRYRPALIASLFYFGKHARTNFETGRRRSRTSAISSRP